MKYINKKIIFISMGLVVMYIVTSSNCIPKSVAVAKGLFLGKEQVLGVDNLVAKQLIEGQKVEALGVYDNQKLDNTTIKHISKTFSLDVATLYTLNRLYQIPQNKAHQDTYLHYLDKLLAHQNLDELEILKTKYILFVPGFAYKEDTTTGADFARQRRLFTQMGVKNKLIETPQFGLSDDNAQIIANEIIAASKQDDEIMIVSASKGGLETAIALGKILDAKALQKVFSWVNVGGILNGSPIADDYLSAPKCWFAELMLWTKGQTIEVVKDISHDKRSKSFAALLFPKHIQIINFVGVPLTAQVHKRIKGQYCSIQKTFGPNDGLTTIPDEITPNGVVISELGLDHYFKDDAIDTKTLALACLAVRKSQKY